MAIRSRAVLTALNQRPHNGVLRAAGTDAAVKLLRSMSLRDGLVGELRERLHEMADAGQIVIECEGNRFDLIATPEALNDTTDDTKDGTEDMIAPAGQRATTSARDGEGHPLPAYLGPEHVGPLTITRRNQAGKVDEAIAAAAELVYDELVKSGKQRYGRDELLIIIQAHLQPLYDGKEEVAGAMAGPVLSHLQCSSRANLVPVPRRRGEFVVEIVVVEPVQAEEPQPKTAAVSELDPIEVLTRLVPELEAARLRITELEATVEGAVSPDMVAQLIEKAEGLQAEKEDLQRQLDEAGTEKEALLQRLETEKSELRTGQRKRLRELRAEHDAVLARIREENARALSELREKLEAALSENASLKAAAAQKPTLPEDLRRRADKLLGN